MNKNGQERLHRGDSYTESEKTELTRGPEGSGGRFRRQHSTSNKSKGTRIKTAWYMQGTKGKLVWLEPKV